MYDNKNTAMPPRPEFNDPLALMLEDVSKTPSQWAGLAQEAENEERWGDAYHYWEAGSKVCTRSLIKAQEMLLKHSHFGKIVK